MKKTIAVLLALLLLCTSFFLTGISADDNFTDVSKSDWFYEDVKYVRENNLMNGTGSTEFSPNGLTTRGMIVTVLWRLEGEPDVGESAFEDVKRDAYYCKAVSWASENKIVTGYDDNHFGPDDAATREQIAAIMHRYAAYKNYALSRQALPDSYTDKNQISAYAVESFEWAYANGIITGTSDETLTPKDYVKRCQVAAILKRLCTNIGASESTGTIGSGISNESQGNSGGISVRPGGASGAAGNPAAPPSQGEESTAGNSGVPTLSVKDVYAKPGDEVSVVVEIEDNPGILGMVLTVYYDESKCTLLGAENGKALSGVLDMTPSKSLGNGARFVWDGIELSDGDVRDGEILVMNFKVKDNASDGGCPITLKYFDGDVLDNNLEEVYLRTENGNIIIKSE